MERRKGQFFAKRKGGKVDSFQKRPRCHQIGALPQQPRDQLKGRDVLLPLLGRGIGGIARKQQPCRRQPHLVGGIEIQGITPLHRRCSEEGIMPLQRR